MPNYVYPNLWRGCVGAWCPSQDRSRADSLTDFSGRNKNGLLVNMEPATDWVPSQGKIALNFDGTNENVDIDSNLGIASKVLSYSAWIYPVSSGYRTVFCIGRDNTLRNVIYLESSDFNLFLFQFVNGSFASSATGPSLTANKWQHVGVLINGTAVVLFVDNVTVNTAIDAGFPSSMNRSSIGAFVDSNGTRINHFNGQIDDVRVYNRDLSMSEIATLALRRGIAYETDRIRRYFIPAAETTVTPPTASLTLTTFVPNILVPSPITVTPSTATIALATFAPTVATPQTITPGNVSLTLATFAPTVSTPFTVVPATAALTLTTFVPTVTAVSAVFVTPTTASLSLATFAPTVSAGGSVAVTPNIATLTLTAFAPTIATPVVITPALLEIVLTPFNPTVINPVTLTPGTASLVLTGYRPSTAPLTDSLILQYYFHMLG